VLDTSAFIAGLDPFSIGGEHYTVPLVRDEIVENSMSGVRFQTAVDSGKLRIKTPAELFLDKVKASATLVGDKFFLSETDLQLLALALELKTNGYLPLIVTDDYSIQNVANQMRIEFASLATFGIRLRLQWIRYCPACHRKYPANSRARSCAVCGTALKRKPLRKSTLNHEGPREPLTQTNREQIHKPK
jgi:UPF0271 protein